MGERWHRLPAIVAGLALALATLGFATPAAAEEAPAPPAPSPSGAGLDPVPVPPDGPGPSSWQRSVGGPPEERVAPAPPSSSSEPLEGDPTRLHVKVRTDADAIRLPQLVAGAGVTPLFSRPPAVLRAERQAAEAATGELLPDLTLWFVVAAADAGEGQRLIELLRVDPGIEMVQPEPVLAPLPAGEDGPVGRDPQDGLQRYLDRGPTGVDARYAWSQPGGSGTAVTVAVIDGGFDLDHVDLDRARAPGVAIPNQPAFNPRHGTNVLGILVADADGTGTKGIVHSAGIRTVNGGKRTSQLADGIDRARAVLHPGDVISISMGVCASSSSCQVVLPLVYSAAARDALRSAGAAGIIPVVSAGNGPADLDGYTSRLGADARSTIVVGAGNPPATAACTAEDGPARGRVASSNYGSRVDLQGWGACVWTTDPGSRYRWWGYTSAATPMVAGAAAAVSSIAETNRGLTLDGSQMRRLLQASGWGQVTGGTRGGRIGPQPDIRAAVAAMASIPGNDMFWRATSIGRFPSSWSYDATWAGVQGGEPPPSCAPIGHTIWYRYRPSADTRISIDTRASDFDTVVAAWEFRGGALREVGCNDRAAPVVDRARLDMNLRAGRDYFFQVGGRAGAAGRIRLTIGNDRGVAETCDLTDDGRSELVIGAPGEGIGAAVGAGLAIAWVGRGDGALVAPTLHGQATPGVAGRPHRGDGFATALGCGDVNGDGHDDVVIGVPREDAGGQHNAGAVQVLLGGAAGLRSAGALFTQELPGIVGTPQRNGRFGTTVAVGDLNGDGYDDTVVGAPHADMGAVDAGAVFVLYGSASGPSPTGGWHFTQDSHGAPNAAERGDLLGAALTVGDIDGDGYDDIAAGAPGETVRGARRAGAVLVIYGSAAGATTDRASFFTQNSVGVTNAAERGDHFGAAVALADIDRDGDRDLVVGAPGETLARQRAAGLVHVLPATPDGVDTRSGDQAISQNSPRIGSGVEAGDRFGWSLAAGDIDGDRDDDLVVGAPGESHRAIRAAGVAHVLTSARGRPGRGGDRMVFQGAPRVSGIATAREAFGSTVAMLDIDGDGRAEVVIGAPGDRRGGRVAGSAHVFHDNGTVVELLQGRGLEDPEDRDAFGAAVAS